MNELMNIYEWLIEWINELMKGGIISLKLGSHCVAVIVKVYVFLSISWKSYAH